MSSRRLVGERVIVKVVGCPTREGVLLAGVKKQTKSIQNFPVRFPNGDVRTYRGDQLHLRGNKAPLLEFIRVGDIVYSKKTLGVVRFIGLHEDYVGTVIVIEPIDPKLPTDPNVKSFRQLFPSANLSDSCSYNLIRNLEEIIKILPPDALLQQLSKIKDTYLVYIGKSREQDSAFEEDMSKMKKEIAVLESEIKEQEKKLVEASNESDFGEVPAGENDEVHQVNVVFKPGKLGIKAIWEAGLVELISENGQAEKLGVQAGWIIVQIDGIEYSEDLLDSKVGGSEEYTMTFEIPIGSDIIKDSEVEPSVPLNPLSNPDIPLKAMLTMESDREKFEREIHDLNEQIEDFQYTIESIQKKNEELEEDHKEMPKVRSKVEQLRTSRTMFMGQIKDMQKRGKEWKLQAEENERKYKWLLAKLQSSGNVSRKVEDPQMKKSDGFLISSKTRVKMPTPDSANTVRLGSKTAFNVGDGSSQSFSLSNLNKKDSKGNLSHNST